MASVRRRTVYLVAAGVLVDLLCGEGRVDLVLGAVAVLLAGVLRALDLDGGLRVAEGRDHVAGVGPPDGLQFADLRIQHADDLVAMAGRDDGRREHVADEIGLLGIRRGERGEAGDDRNG